MLCIEICITFVRFAMSLDVYNEVYIFKKGEFPFNINESRRKSLQIWQFSTIPLFRWNHDDYQIGMVKRWIRLSESSENHCTVVSTITEHIWKIHRWSLMKVSMNSSMNAFMNFCLVLFTASIHKLYKIFAAQNT